METGSPNPELCPQIRSTREAEGFVERKARLQSSADRKEVHFDRHKGYCRTGANHLSRL